MNDKYARDLLKSGKYTDKQWNQYALWRYVNYFENAVYVRDAKKEK